MIGEEGAPEQTLTTITEGVDPNGRPYLWIGNFLSDTSSDHGTDLAAMVEGAVAVTPLHLDLTLRDSLSPLEAVFR